MRRAIAPILLPIVVMASACVSEEDSKMLRVPDSPFGVPPAAPPPVRAAYAPATTQVAARVDTVGRNILAANPQVGIRPMFLTIGAPQPEVFHRGTSELGITEGLVKQCITDAQLAAVLCNELGKMVSEREALAGPETRIEPPQEVRVGNDYGGSYGSSDLTHLAEQAKFRAPGAHRAAPVLPDPKALARDYLTKAGYTAADLDQAEPILKTATSNSALEKQLTSPGPTRPWTR